MGGRRMSEWCLDYSIHRRAVRAFRAGGCDYISRDGEGLVVKDLTTLGSGIGEKLYNGVLKLGSVLDSPGLAPCIGCSSKAEVTAAIVWWVLIIVAVSIDVYRERHGLQPMFCGGRGGYVGPVGGFGGVAGGFY